MKRRPEKGASATPVSPPGVTCWGAAGEVSGSMHLVDTPAGLLLLDCGLSFEHRHARGFPFNPERLRGVILSHAHLDHSGLLPLLVRQGYTGPIYCTPATRDLIHVLLADSARIQEEDAIRAMVRASSGHALAQPLYRVEDAEQTIDQCIPVAFDEVFAPVPDVEAWLRPAGHVLGSAMIHLRSRWREQTVSLTYTGDLGRAVLPLHRPPAAVPPADLVLCESTYGGGQHEPLPDLLADLRAIVVRTLERAGKVYIPAFSLGRTQLMVYFLLQLMETGQMPTCPVVVDSPLGVRITALYRRYFDELGIQVRQACGHDPRRFLAAPHLRFITDAQESRELSAWSEPGIIVASSGMGEGGRIVHHLMEGVEDPRNSVILVSYQAPGTLGARLLEPGPTVRLLGRQVNKWADVFQLRGFSAHADQAELLDSLREVLAGAGRLTLVHGDREQASALAQVVRQRSGLAVTLAEPGRRLLWCESPEAAPRA